LDYYQNIRLTRLDGATIERRWIDGQDEEVLVLPIKSACLTKGANGDVDLQCVCHEIPLNPKNRTHKVRVMFKTQQAVADAQKHGTYDDMMCLGYMARFIDNTKLKLDYQNFMTDIYCVGFLDLDAILPSDIKANPRTRHRMVRMIFKKLPQPNSQGDTHQIVISRSGYNDEQSRIAILKQWQKKKDFDKAYDIFFTGAFDLDMISNDDIRIDSNTGCRMLPIAIMKSPLLDLYGNSHKLIVSRANLGHEDVQIGLFRQWAKRDRPTIPKGESPEPYQQQQFTVSVFGGKINEDIYKSQKTVYIDGLEF
jgi:uncharacterized protein YneF (UPF0154 family)